MSQHFLEKLPALACTAQDPAKAGVVFSILVAPEHVRQAATLCRERGYHLEDVSASEVQEGTLILYHFDHFETPGRIRCMTVSPDNQVDSIADIYSGADWHERECFDFFGTDFTGHPNLILLLLAPNADRPPLKKADSAKVALATLYPWVRALQEAAQ